MEKGIESITTSLEIDEQLSMHKRGWTAQTAGLIFIFFLIATSAAGLYGDGVVSKRIARQDNMAVEWQRFYRFEARMIVKVSAKKVANKMAVITFDNQYLEHFQIESILPEPSGSAFSGNSVSYTFPANGNAAIQFFLIPRKVGRVAGTMRVNETVFPLDHFIFP